MLPVTHVLLDYENVQPTEDDLRALVPAVTKVWVFHGPYQKQVESRFASFGPDVTAVPISRTGRNALDFHLSFYMGYIVSRDQRARIVVVANDKGYDPMLEHAKEMGFTVSKVGYCATGATEIALPQSKAAAKAAPKIKAKKPAVKTVALAKPTTRAKQVAAKTAITQRSPAKKSSRQKRDTQNVQISAVPGVGNEASIGGGAVVSPAVIERIVAGLRKMQDKRPARMTSLRRALKPLLGVAASEEAIDIALNRLIPMGIVGVGASGDVNYPKFSR